jgi:hypothetical protein
MISPIACSKHVVKYSVTELPQVTVNATCSADLRGALTPHVKKHQAAVRPEELPSLLRAIASYDTVGDKQTRLAL